MKNLISKIALTNSFTIEEILSILENTDADEFLFEKADEIRRKFYAEDVYIRGLIELSNYCKNNCYYCGIRAANTNIERYRLTKEEILSCCDNGYNLGFRTFVLQGGEDTYYTDSMLCGIIEKIKSRYPDCAVTLSLGEREYASYKRLYDAGADRYLLRHETADKDHYQKLHPHQMNFENRMQCLFNLKEIGYQVGAGFMVGSPYQTNKNLALELKFLSGFQPQMVGIGPFIPHLKTPFGAFKAGTLRNTLVMIALTRLVLPHALIPATTALGTISPNGRELGLKAGANVVMPNLSPVAVRKKYELYENKICTGEEAAECRLCLQRRVAGAGYKIVVDRGDYK